MQRRIFMKKWITAILAAWMLLSCVFCAGCGKADSLTAAEIQALRDKYPLITNITIEYPMFNLDVRLPLVPYLAEIEVVRTLPDYTVEIASDGRKDTVLFHAFEVKVRETLINRTEKPLPETLVISYADVFSSSYPVLTEGAQFIVSLTNGKGSHEGRHLFFDDTCYYVTESGHLLSVYTERGTTLSGLTKSAAQTQINKLAKK